MIRRVSPATVVAIDVSGVTHVALRTVLLLIVGVCAFACGEHLPRSESYVTFRDTAGHSPSHHNHRPFPLRVRRCQGACPASAAAGSVRAVGRCGERGGMPLTAAGSTSSISTPVVDTRFRLSRRDLDSD